MSVCVFVYKYITIVERYGVVPVNYDRGDEGYEEGNINTNERGKYIYIYIYIPSLNLKIK